MTMRRQRREDPAYLTAMREAKELFDAEMAKNSMKGRGRPKTVVAAAPAAVVEVEIDHEVADEIVDLSVDDTDAAEAGDAGEAGEADVEDVDIEETAPPRAAKRPGKSAASSSRATGKMAAKPAKAPARAKKPVAKKKAAPAKKAARKR
jgi:hypothetical protein